MSILYAADLSRTRAITGAVRRLRHDDQHRRSPRWDVRGEPTGHRRVPRPRLGYRRRGPRVRSFARRRRRGADLVARLQRSAASPGAAIDLLTSYNLVDVRAALPLVQAPTLVLHRRDDRIVDVRLGREIADGIPDARIIEYPGADHFLLTTNVDDIVDDLADSLTGSAPDLEPDRRLATVLFTDIVSSTEQLGHVGDATWRHVLDRHDHVVEAAVARTAEGTSSTPATGRWRCSTDPAGRCDAPSRSPPWTPGPASRCELDFTPARSSNAETTSPASPCTWHRGFPLRRPVARSSCRAPSSTLSLVPGCGSWTEESTS